MTTIRNTLVHAQRVRDEINDASEQPLTAISKLPGLAKYLAKVLLLLCSEVALQEARLTRLEAGDDE